MELQYLKHVQNMNIVVGTRIRQKCLHCVNNMETECNMCCIYVSIFVLSLLGQIFFIFRLSRIATVFFQEMEKKFKFRFFIADRMKIVPNLKKTKQTE